MDENVCYEAPKLSSTSFKYSVKGNNSLLQDSCIKKGFLLLFVLLLALLLGTVCACIAFALEISKLKSETASLQVVSAFQQSQNALEIKLENSTRESNEYFNATLNLIYQQLNQHYSALDEKLQGLNSSSHQEFSQVYSELDNRTQLLNMTAQLILHALETPGMYSFHPVDSCAALPPSSPSGYYWVLDTTGSPVLVYCDMTRSCGGVTGGWVRVAELDMTNSSHQCPSGLRQRTDSNRRTCGISVTSGCSSVTFSTAGLRYSKVCGKIKAYQVGVTSSFALGSRGINGIYVDGISLTHGSQRQHIWTFASALDEVGSHPRENCPCTNTNSANRASPPPAFVGGDYFCDTGSAVRYIYDHFYGDDPLWDGAGCGPLNTCCSLNNPPWFYKQLPQPTTDDIEMRGCRGYNREDIATEIVDIYIQ